MDLCRETTTDEGVKHQLVLPIAHVPTVMDALYNDMGNPGKGGIISLMKDMWYWPGIYSNVETLIDHLSRVCEMQQEKHVTCILETMFALICFWVISSLTMISE